MAQRDDARGARPLTIKRNLVVQRWGTPAVTIGSVNEPREREEHGVVFNEKWIYRDLRADPGQPRERVIYWHRYDFVASFVIDAGGRLVAEDPRALLEGLTDRSYDARADARARGV